MRRPFNFMIMKKLICMVLGLLILLPAFAREAKPSKKNLVVKEWNTDVKTNAKTLDHVTTYNAVGKKIEEIEYYSDGTQKWRERYEYDASGRLVKETVYDARNRLYSIKKTEYNEIGRKKTKYVYDAKGKVKTVKVYEYLVQDDE